MFIVENQEILIKKKLVVCLISPLTTFNSLGHFPENTDTHAHTHTHAHTLSRILPFSCHVTLYGISPFLKVLSRHHFNNCLAHTLINHSAKHHHFVLWNDYHRGVGGGEETGR